jgi:hypothetical protein
LDPQCDPVHTFSFQEDVKKDTEIADIDPRQNGWT